MLHYIALHYIAADSTALHYIPFYNLTTLHCIPLRYIVYIALHYLHYIASHCIAWHYVAIHTSIHQSIHTYIQPSSNSTVAFEHWIYPQKQTKKSLDLERWGFCRELTVRPDLTWQGGQMRSNIAKSSWKRADKYVNDKQKLMMRTTPTTAILMGTGTSTLTEQASPHLLMDPHQSWTVLTRSKYLASSYLLSSFRGWRLHIRSCRPLLRGGRGHKGPWRSSPKWTRRSLPAGPRNRSWLLRVITWLTTSSRTLVTWISSYLCT